MPRKKLDGMRIQMTRLQQRPPNRRCNQLDLHPLNRLQLFTQLPKPQTQHFSNQRNPEDLMTRSPKPTVMAATTWLVPLRELRAVLLEVQRILERVTTVRKRTGSRRGNSSVYSLHLITGVGQSWGSSGDGVMKHFYSTALLCLPFE